MPHLPEQVREDLEYILLEVTTLPSLLDEVTLLRVALRRYMEGHPAEEAVAWAAQQLSNELARIP